jgi:altronate hydrolase
MKKSVLKVHPADNVIVALRDLSKGEEVQLNGRTYTLAEDIAAKHKFTEHDFKTGDKIIMYGVLVGKVQYDIHAGTRISTSNVKHASTAFHLGDRKTSWHAPDVSKFAGRTFMGFHRSDGSVGTANHWLVIPLVFCENRNIEVLKESLVDELGFGRPKKYNQFAQQLKELYTSGISVQEILDLQFQEDQKLAKNDRLFKNIDGVKFITHQGGCGGTRQDAQALCGLLAGYVTHPNVAGVTVLSLGCQNAQVAMLEEEIAKRMPDFDKPLYILEQQKSRF